MQIKNDETSKRLPFNALSWTLSKATKADCNNRPNCFKVLTLNFGIANKNSDLPQSILYSELKMSANRVSIKPNAEQLNNAIFAAKHRYKMRTKTITKCKTDE